ncbi:MAG TPA: zinc ribbon domain-containing protein [Actinomycetota bacterium]|nr:zinc ribbon domain-containing protein [Actinomycetota bacterium]
MPVYEFRCADCGESFDRLLPLRAAEPPCPACGSANVRRLISLIAGLAGSASGSGSPDGCACGGACTCRR